MYTLISTHLALYKPTQVKYTFLDTSYYCFFFFFVRLQGRDKKHVVMSFSEFNTTADKVSFNTDVSDKELQDVEREVDMLQEGLKLKSLQEAAAEDEGTRKKATPMGASTVGAVSPNSKSSAKSIFLSGFDPHTTESDIRLFFSPCGTIVRITLLRDKTTGLNKGSAYLEFETPEQAQASLLKDGQSFHGRPLKVAIKRDNIPGFHHRGGASMGGGGYYGAPRGRGGVPPGLQPQQMAAMAMLSMMSGAAPGMGFTPYPTRGRGRGRGRGG